ncbi:MAG TPA: LCP family protein [Chloroflexota bacterium]|nr:LCP family protein [Chloroflexota bacterium]
MIGTFLFFLLSAVLSAGIVLFCPPVLEAMSSIILPPQPGMVPWNGHDRITVVAMGLTQRTTEPARTDTLLVMDIDPSTHHVSMLSVPRDLWVDIPGYGQGKLAIAYELGGPKLAAYTLERDLQIPVDYTMAMTFRGFIKLIDAMGGVDVNVPRELNDPTYPCLTGYAYCPIDIKSGEQHMDGATALEFVRERHAFVQQDLARVQDQQAFSDAVKRTIISPATWLRYPAILTAFKQSLMTNLPLNDLPEVGVQYMLGGRGQTSHSYININNGLVQTGWSNDGQSILVPTSPNAITNLTHHLFADPQLARENASVAVLNGSSTTGAASDAGSTLQGLGFRVVTAGNADRTDYARTEVIENLSAGAADYTARRLQRLLGATLVRQSIPSQTAQIVVVLGRDFVG